VSVAGTTLRVLAVVYSPGKGLYLQLCIFLLLFTSFPLLATHMFDFLVHGETIHRSVQVSTFVVLVCFNIYLLL